MNRELKLLVLSALLRNVGKFARRAKAPCSENRRGEKETSGYRHLSHTDYFIENDLPLPEEMDDSRSRIARIASARCKSDEDSRLAAFLTIAEGLSSGRERIEEEKQDADSSEKRLVSVFEEVELLKHRFASPGEYGYDPVPLKAGSENIFPRRNKAKEESRIYQNLFAEFMSELRKSDLGLEFSFYLDGLISTLEKYLWCIPSAFYKTVPDVSLFDHSITTAGIAQALYLRDSYHNRVPRWEDRENKFILLVGELSGIRNYVFDIDRNSRPGLSKIFRARSFFVQALTESLFIELRQRLDILSVCRLSNAAGKFMCILPCIETVQQKLGQFEEDVQVWFRRKFKGLLTMNLSYEIRMTQQDFELKQFRSKIEAVENSLEKAKCCKLKRTFALSGPVISEDYEETEHGNCSLCRIQPVHGPSVKLFEEKEGLSIPVCEDCCKQIIYIGTHLPERDFLIYGNQGEVSLFGNIKLSFSEKAPVFDSSATDQDKKIFDVETLGDKGNFRRTRTPRYLPEVTKAEMKNPLWLSLFEQESGKSVEFREHQPKTFGMIAQKSKKIRENKIAGRKLLSFFKADVDNLGLIFSPGLKDRLSAARFVSLSRMLNFFFSEYAPELIRRNYPDIYVVFAGGDDLFTAGPWRETVRFAITLRKKFSLFCAENPDISLSGAILTAKPRFPMRKAAELVHTRLQEAKERDMGKNAVSFLGEILSWTRLEELIAIGEKFDKAVEEKKRTNFSTDFLHRLMTYHEMYRKFVHEKKISFGRYLSLAHYDIGKNICTERNSNREEVEMLYRIFAVDSSQRTELENLNIPLFYAVNLNRTEE